MASFLTDLWQSVFTPGPTPTLLIATNVTFAALQTLLAALLVATQSIHFAILSVLCGGLWYSINWFAMELHAAQAEEKAKEAQAKKDEGKRVTDRQGEGEADDEGEDTEVEDMARSRVELGKESRQRSEDTGVSGSGVLVGGVATGTGSEQAAAGAEVRQRRVEDMDRSGEVSTDSEWEKVSQDGDR